MRRLMLAAVMLVAISATVASAQTTVNFTNGGSGFCNPRPVRNLQGIQIANSYYCVGMQITPMPKAWAAMTEFNTGDRIIDTNGNVEVVTQSGTTGFLEPIWPPYVYPYPATDDGSVVWVNINTPPNYFSVFFIVPLGTMSFTGGNLYEGHYFVYGNGALMPSSIPDFTAVNLQGMFDGNTLFATFAATPTQPVSGAITESFGTVRGPCYKQTCQHSRAIVSGMGSFSF